MPSLRLLAGCNANYTSAKVVLGRRTMSLPDAKICARPAAALPALRAASQMDHFEATILPKSRNGKNFSTASRATLAAT